MLKVKNVELKDKSKCWWILNQWARFGVSPFFSLRSGRIISGSNIYFFNIKFSALFNTIYK
ncbi:hypothetical protein, partial [Campylobacter concisus]|uniref:hypothetical protein n=1 Tax=Campylobacter concisus TaxID=199 RepID=UPI001CA5BB02